MKSKKYITYLILGLGLGIIITNILYSAYPKVELVELNDDVIVERARELGMVPVKESIKLGKDIEDPEYKGSEEVEEEVIKLEESEEVEKGEIINEEIEIVIERGANLTEIAIYLYEIGVIENKDDFADVVRANNLSGKIDYGYYNIKKDSSNYEIIEILTGINPQNDWFLWWKEQILSFCKKVMIYY